MIESMLRRWSEKVERTLVVGDTEYLYGPLPFERKWYIVVDADARHTLSFTSPTTTLLERLYEIEQKYRMNLWLQHGHYGLYGDDGEMQCSQCLPYGVCDYKRDPLEKLEAAATQITMERVAEFQKGIASIPVRLPVRKLADYLEGK